MANKRTATPVALTAAQRDRLESLWFVYGNYGPKETYGNHQFIQGLLERGEDARPLCTSRTPARERPTPECEAAVDAVLKGEGEGLRLVKSMEARPTPVPDPDFAVTPEDLKRSYREWSEWMGHGPDGQEEGREEGREEMGDEDRCAACGAVIGYEVHINPDGEGAADGQRFCSVECAAGQGAPDGAEKRAAEGAGE